MIGGRSWPYWIFIAILVVLYFVLHLALGLGASVPDLLTVAVLLGARRLRGWSAAALGLGLGLLRDSLVLAGFGANAIALTVVGYLGARSRDFFVGDSLLFIAFYLFVGTWLFDVLYFLIARPGAEGATVTRLLIEAPLAAAYAAVAGVVALLIFRIVSGER